MDPLALTPIYIHQYREAPSNLTKIFHYLIEKNPYAIETLRDLLEQTKFEYEFPVKLRNKIPTGLEFIFASLPNRTKAYEILIRVMCTSSHFFESEIKKDVRNLDALLKLLEQTKSEQVFPSELRHAIPSRFDFIFASPENRANTYRALNCAMGRLYEHGHFLCHSLEQSYQYAALHYSRAAEQGCEESRVAATRMYLEGKGFCDATFDYAQDILSKEGSSLAQCQLRQLHAQWGKDKELLDTHPGNVSTLLATANPRTLFQLGNSSRLGDKPDLASAIQYYRAALERGCLDSREQLLALFIEGKGLTGNEAYAIKILTPIANRALTQNQERDQTLRAKYQLAKLHWVVKGPQYKIEFLNLLCQAAEGGFLDAIVELRNLYRKGSTLLEITRNKELEDHYLLLAAEQGDTESIRLVACDHNKFADKASPNLLFRIAIQVVNSTESATAEVKSEAITQAQTYLERAINEGFTKAKGALGQLFLRFPEKYGARGKEILQLLTEASDYFPSGAMDYVLWEIYFKGRPEFGIEKNLELAQKYLTMSAYKGHAQSQYLLGEQYRIEKEYVLAETYLTKAATQGKDQAKYALGKLYLSQCEERFQVFKQNNKYQFDLITFIYDDQSELKNPELRRLFNSAIEQFKQCEKPDAFYQLAMLYPITRSEYESYLLKAHNKNVPFSALLLGMLYLGRKDSLISTKNRDLAIEHFEAAFHSKNESEKTMAALQRGKIYTQMASFSLSDKYTEDAEFYYQHWINGVMSTKDKEVLKTKVKGTEALRRFHGVTDKDPAEANFKLGQFFQAKTTFCSFDYNQFALFAYKQAADAGHLGAIDAVKKLGESPPRHPTYTGDRFRNR